MVQMDGPPTDQRDIITSPYFPYGSCPFVFNCVELIQEKNRIILQSRGFYFQLRFTRCPRPV